MKKKLLFGMTALAAVVSLQDARAQLAAENFNSGSLPANWVLISDGRTVSTSFTGSAAIQASLNSAAWAPVQFVSSTDYSMITTSMFNPAGTADRWLITPPFTVTSANTVFKWDSYDLNSGEELQVLVSPTAGTTAASFTQTLFNGPASVNASGLQTHAVSLSAYNGQTIRMAFRDHDTDNWGLVVDNVSTTILPNAVESSLEAIAPVTGSAFSFGAVGSTRQISGMMKNNGAQAVTSYTINYKRGTSPTVSQTITPASPIQPLTTDIFTFTTPVAIAAAGNNPVKIWITVAGDANTANDTLNTVLVGVESMQPLMSLFEEFSGASCDPCAIVTPNVDSVVSNNLSRMNAIRYHVPIPARDLLYNVTKYVVDPRMNFYGINSAPSGALNGVDIYPGAGWFTSALVDEFEPAGSPFQITGTAAYNAGSQTFTVNADIKAFAAFPAGLKAYAALTIDTITYTTNISLANLEQKEFPQVVEHIFPNGNGTTLAAFASGQSQQLALSWVKDHEWGDRTGGFNYKATSTGAIVIWVQDPVTKNVFQSLSLPLSGLPTGTVSIEDVIANNASLQIYPNPATTAATVRFDVKAATEVGVQVLDVLGNVVRTIPTQKLGVGTQEIAVPVSGLSSGVYNVRLSTQQGNVSRKLTIVK